MTLVQTGKHPVIPIVLFGKEYWEKVVNFEAMAEMGTINISDLDNILGTTPCVHSLWQQFTRLPAWLAVHGCHGLGLKQLSTDGSY